MSININIYVTHAFVSIHLCVDMPGLRTGYGFTATITPSITYIEYTFGSSLLILWWRSFNCTLDISCTAHCYTMFVLLLLLLARAIFIMILAVALFFSELVVIFIVNPQPHRHLQLSVYEWVATRCNNYKCKHTSKYLKLAALRPTKKVKHWTQLR